MEIWGGLGGAEFRVRPLGFDARKAGDSRHVWLYRD